MSNRMRVCGNVGVWGGIVLLAFAVAGCSKGLNCPAGTVEYGGTCKAADDPGEGGDIVMPEILHDDGTGDGALEDADAPGGDVVQDVPKDTTGKDVPDAVTYPGGVIGKACQTSQNCRNDEVLKGTCLGWTLGYCTLKGCGTGEVACPEGAVCMGIALDQPACAQSCTGDADCRVKDGYACKLLPDPAGELKRICHQVATAGAPGDGCTTADDCAGEAGCLSNFPGGYCAVLSCSADAPCPDGTRCVLLGGKSVCLKACAGLGDVAGCVVAGDLPRACIERREPATGLKVNVCGSAAAGGLIGTQCLNETECASGRCDVAATGTCSQSMRPCKLDNDCGGAEACLQDSTKTFGFCTQKCSSSVACPSLSMCVETVAVGTTKGEGRCMPGCTEGTQCRTEAGMACRYGDPWPDPSRYACVALGLGEIATACTADGDCRIGTCLHGAKAGATGYCSTACASLFGSICPFPTACGTLNAAGWCLLRCRSDVDCLGDTRCDTELAAPVCVPKA